MQFDSSLLNLTPVMNLLIEPECTVVILLRKFPTVFCSIMKRFYSMSFSNYVNNTVVFFPKL